MFDIPIIINNFNRLTTTKKLADDLSNLGYTNIHILDNNSSYGPLLEWYSVCPYSVKRLSENQGNLAIYNSGFINEFKGWVAYTDSDIQLGETTPRDFMSVMVRKADKHNYNKIGLALRTNDLPNTDYANKARNWEAKYWEREIEPDLYEAHVDTTFSLIKVGLAFQYEALRLGGEYTAIHTPWYLNYSNLSDEEKYVANHADPTFSTTKRYVNSLSLGIKS